MRAVVYRGVNDLRLETVPVPRIGANELLVKVAVCGVCPTDIKKIQHGTVPPPRIFGHETAGTIWKLGVGSSKLGFKVGDRVALHHHVPCLKCHYCRHRAFAQCATYKRTGITAGFEPAGGGYAEYVRVMPFVLPGVVKIPSKNSFAEGALLEPVNTVLKAVKRLNLLPGDNVLVAGQGPIGLMFTKILQLARVNVLATDLLESRLKLAKQFGAKWIADPRPGRAELLLRQAARQRVPTSLDAAVIAVPSDAAVLDALQRVRGGGQVLLFAHTKRAAPVSLSARRTGGAVPSPAGAGEGARRADEGCQGENKLAGRGENSPNPISRFEPLQPQDAQVADNQVGDLEVHGEVGSSAFSLDPASICLDEKDLIGSYSSDFTLQAEVARLVFSRRLDVRGLISHCFPLEQTAAAVALAASPTPDSLKILVQNQAA